MNLPKRLTLLLLSLGLGATVHGQDFTELWVLGDPDNGGQTEFSQEGGTNGAPGSADAQDDDFYFAGSYEDPIGVVPVDEAFVNFDRALTPGDAINRIHFNLDSVGADPGTQLRLTVQTCCLGAAEGIDPTHDVTVRVNGNEIFSQSDIVAALLIEETFSASSVSAQEGANVIEIERTAGSTSSWIQFDYIRLELGASDNDSDGMPNSYEEQYAFLNKDDAADAALDQDNDGLSNVGEFLAKSDPTKADTDGDGLPDGVEVNTHNTNPNLADSDRDGLNDAIEINDSKSNPLLADTDGDTLNDGAEVNTHMTSPLLVDTDTDGVDDATEVALNTDPNDSGDIPVLFSQLWQLGNIDRSQAEFSQETSGNEAPGSANEQDDDYYFAGTYGIGVVPVDEATTNYDRALTGGDPINRIHFNLDDISASEGAEYRVRVQFYGLGPADGTSTHNVVMRLNDHEFFSQTDITGDLLVDALVTGADAATKVGENVLTIERTDGAGWIQFDYLTLDFRTSDTDRDRLPNSYEAKFAFLNPSDPSDAAKDQDSDGLTNLEEFENNTTPDIADTDSDGLNDGPEVKEYGSKPRVPDTDGDGLLDGAEVNTHKTLVLDVDTDDDGLWDGDEIAAGTSPFEVDTDQDGETDNDEVLYGSNPTDPNSTPLPFQTLWQIGEDDGGQAEFPQEKGPEAAPGSAEAQDDDFYFAGNYPDPIGVVVADEPFANYDRALTSGDAVNRIHFNLAEELIEDTTQMRVVIDFVQLGSAAGIEDIHDIAVRVNGNQIYAKTDIVEDTFIQASFLPAQVGAVTGENIIEIERTGQTASSWIQFDYVSLEQRAILTDDPNLLVQTRNIFGELPNASKQTRTLEITNTGQENALNISNVTITGDDRDHYTVTGVPAMIGPREKATFTISFDPKGQAGGFTAFLEFTSDDSGDTIVSADLSALINNANGLVSHYTFDETSGDTAFDVSGRGRHAQYEVTGEGVFALGQDPLASGKSVSLTHGATGAAFARVQDTFDPFVDTTVSVWFQAATDGGVLTLLSKNADPEVQGDPFAIVYSDASLTIFSAGSPIASIEGVSVNTPHHLVVAFENAAATRSIAVYLDGEEVYREDDVDGFDDSTNSPIEIGALSGGFGFQGLIDDLQIYNKVLTAEDVTFLMTNPGEELAGEVVVDPDADDDGDGQSNTLENIAGTDPNDPSSFFTLPTPQRSPEGIRFGWDTVAGTTYVLEYSTTLSGAWTEVTTITAAATMTEFVDTDAARNGDSEGYYRLSIPQ